MIHNLIELMMLSEEIDPTFEMLRSDLIVLERYSVRFRYPGTSAFKDEAQAAYQAAKVAREFCRPKLGLS